LRDIARQFRFSKDAISRHQKGCVAEALAKRTETQELALQDRLLAEMEGLQAKTLAILEKTSSEEPRVALAAIAEARHNIALVARMTGRLDPVQEQDKNDGRLITYEELKVIIQSRRVSRQ
jgi:hypothetical protein